ncbi:FKBP-type peptidyl-prolyl cis-trans isomerase [uncultured Microbacterium sp.]|uniref:FKBP-type peptidyl-prolyl cis-trans isomerase n=1 Tax=uncultured Microbacterium sp. TaxID=191216 RepID=UPI0035C95B87
MRIRPIVTLSVVAAAAALVLSGCTASSTPAASESPSATTATDLCSAAAPTGAASEAVKVDGAFGTDSTASFTSPLDIASLQRTVVTEGSGDPIQSGDYISFALTGYDASTGAKLGSQGYTPGELAPAEVTTGTVLSQIVGCAAPGTRIVAVAPGTDASTPGTVYVVDVLSVMPLAATGEPQAPTAGFPTVTLDSTGAPTVALPQGDIPTSFEKATLKKGDGPVVGVGDTVIVQYYGYSWNNDKMFDQSWGKQVFSFTVGTGVVQGFSDAVTGETVGSQVIAVLPPSAAYGDGAINDSDLKGQTLIFVVDILGVQHAPAQ